MTSKIYKNEDKVLRSLFGDVTVPRVTLHDHILKSAAKYGDNVALVDIATKRQYTYSEFISACHKVAAALYQHGVRHGDIILLISPNDIDYAVAIFAITSLGGTISTVNPASTADELAIQLEDSDASWIITGPTVADKAKEVAKRFANIKETFVFGDVAGCTSFSSLITEGGPEPPAVTIDLNNDVILLPYSSGTTGKPKGVMLTHHNIMANLAQIAHPAIGMDRGEGAETFIAFLPFYHIYGMVVLLYHGLERGHKLAVVPKFGVEEYLTAIQEYKGTVLHIVPPIAVLLAKHPAVDNYDLSSAHEIFCGAAPMSKELGEAIQKRLNIATIRQGYGMTELSPVCHISPKDGWKHGSAGLVVTGSECRVIGADGNNLGPGEDGEILIKGPQAMKGYYKRPDATAITMDTDGWLHTGDIGHYDEDGHFFVVDRLKELIKYKGFQVAPAELEATILTHPAVADVCVVGLLDEEAGELPMAFVVKKPDVDAEAEDIIKFVHERVSPHKRLRGGVQFTDKIPKSPSGKILRRILRDQARQEFGKQNSTKM